MRFIVKKSPRDHCKGILIAGNYQFPCALGRSGIGTLKQEGDGITPFGDWGFRYVYYRPDRVKRPYSQLRVHKVQASDGWCDTPWDANYNRFVNLPYSSRSETLWREDEIYDIIVVLTHNYVPRIQGAGSAIFMHVARESYSPTEGCVALSLPHLRMLLSLIDKNSLLSVQF